MLNSFRRGGLVQMFMGAVILIIIAAFALDFRGKSSKFDKECVVEVDSTCVPPRDFNAAFALSGHQDLTAKQIRQLKIRQMVLDGLVERELLLEEARRLGVSITEDSVDAELELGRFHFSMPAERDAQLPMLTYVNVRHPKTDVFDYDVYQRTVRSYARMSTKDFKAHQTEELIADRMRELVKSGVRISEVEARSQFESARTKATVRVAQISSDWFARFLVSLSDEAVEQYASTHTGDVDAAFTEHGASFTEGCPLVSEIFFAFPPAADEADEAATRTRAEQVRARVQNGSSAEFDTLARVHSAAPSALYGGRRGCLQASDGDEAAQFVKAVDGLPPGGISELVALPRGFHLLRLDQRLTKDETTSVGRLRVALPLATQTAAEQLTREFAQALQGALGTGKIMQDALDVLTANALSQVPALPASQPGAKGQKGGAPNELRAAASESRDKPQIDVSPSFSRFAGVNPIANAQAGANVKQLAFSLKAIGDVYPEPIPTRDGLAVIQLKDIEPAKPEDFDKEKAEFIRELKQRAQSDALTTYVSNLRKAHESEIKVDQRFLEEKTGASDDT
jgi:peptidyl-prolyl cis-trans isomerase D